MEFLTAGLINETIVDQFFDCLCECRGDIRDSLLIAYDRHNLNTNTSTEVNDSWHEALAQYKAA